MQTSTFSPHGASGLAALVRCFQRSGYSRLLASGCVDGSAFRFQALGGFVSVKRRVSRCFNYLRLEFQSRAYDFDGSGAQDPSAKVMSTRFRLTVSAFKSGGSGLEFASQGRFFWETTRGSSSSLVSLS